MDVYDIVRSFLLDKGYDGLYNEDGECACLLKDLAPCEEICSNCCAGYKVMCNSEICDHEVYDFTDGNWHIQAQKPKENNNG